MRKNIKLLLKYVKNEKKLVIVSLFCALISSSSRLLIPFFAGKTVNLLIDGNASNQIMINFIIMSICLFLGLIFKYLFEFTTNLIGQNITKRIRDEVYSSYLNAPVSYIDQNQKGDLVSKLINDTENVQLGLISGIATLYDGIISILFIIGFMLALNWALAIIVVGLTPLSIFVAKFVSKYNSKYFKKQAKANASLTAYSLETLNHSENIKTLNIKEYRQKEFDELNDNNRKSLFKANLGASTINPTTRLINALINTSIILIGAIFIIKKANLGVVFSVGELLSFITYANNYTQPFNDVSNVISDIFFAFSSLARIDNAITTKKAEDNGKKEVNEIKEIELKDISFKYPNNDRWILDGLNLKIKQGQKIAFVGPTGCGKTTIINLLMRFYDPNKGEVDINNDNLRNFTKSSFYDEVGMVLQETWIFNGTVFENIAYGKKDATMEEVIEAAKKAKADDFISRMKDGYNTIINNSSSLSIGERQLICIARVMLANPDVMILDEATSNIDIRTELLLNQSFFELMKGKTSFVVAHRLNTIITSDVICVINNGAIIEAGSHKELLEKKGFYYNLFNSQFN